MNKETITMMNEAKLSLPASVFVSTKEAGAVAFYLFGPIPIAQPKPL